MSWMYTAAFVVSLLGMAAGDSTVAEVESKDRRMLVAVNTTTGKVFTVNVNGRWWDVQGGSEVEGVALSSTTVTARNGSVLVVREGDGVRLEETFTAAATSVKWEVAVMGEAGWGKNVTTTLVFLHAERMKLWAPWNVNGEDPLVPSHGMLLSWGSWHYSLGCASCKDNVVVAEHVTVMDDQVSASLIGSPEGVYQGYLSTTGHDKCPTPTSCFGPASFTIGRENLRFPARFEMDFVPHDTIDVREGLQWSVTQYPSYWNPVSTATASVDGLGSYSWYTGDLDPSLRKMGYKVDWDLGGKFFPYMGMFLPPVGPNDTWWNDPEGTQAHANWSFAQVDAYYRKMAEQGYAALSYFNIFEYGRDVVYSNDPPTGKGDWHNASSYLAGFLRDAMLNDSVCLNNRRTHGAPFYTWQRAVVMDPQQASYRGFLREQVQRKLKYLASFQGIVIDRSDWCACYSFTGDDGESWVEGRAARSLEVAWRNTTAMLRDEVGDKVMLMNTMGYAWLPLMKWMDGTFSEGGNVNAAGLLGLRSPAVLWTYDAKECCADDATADRYFQSRLHVKVFPMVPFPDADHSIAPGDPQNGYYLMYGPMFAQLSSYRWKLQPAFPVLPRGETSVWTNAFSNGTHSIFTVMLGGDETEVTLQVAGVLPTTRFDVFHPSAEAWVP
eukprot:Sspe_Gene.66321::Locus_39186_Transcript_1_1_Confidence_1.000_Length_2040::g.66321::m.66321